MDNEINLFEVLLAKKLAGNGGGGSAPFTLVQITTEIPEVEDPIVTVTMEVNP